MGDAVFIDIPMDVEVVNSFYFQDRTVNLQLGYDKLGLEFGQMMNTSQTPIPTATTMDHSDTYISKIQLDISPTHTTETQVTTTKLFTDSPNNSPSNSPIIRHKLSVTKNLNNIRKSRPNLVAAKRAHRKRFSVGDIYEDNREMDRLTFEFNAKVKVNRKKKIEMKTFKTNIVNL